jgi:cytochrome c553
MNLNALMLLFFIFAMGLPLYGMQNNEIGGGNTNACIGDCYQQWKAESGGVVAVAVADAAARAEASPEELGKLAYAGCIACHGAGGEGGVGPALAGQDSAAISGALVAYRNGETRGNQSALMWSQAAQLSEVDIEHLAAFIATL